MNSQRQGFDLGKSTFTSEEWKSIHENALIVLEQNDLLHHKLDAMKNQMEATATAHKEKTEKLKSKIKSLEEERAKLKSGLADMERHCTLLTNQITHMTNEIKERIPKAEHESSVRECQRLFNELKTSYAEERKTLITKLNEAEEEKKQEQDRLGSQVESALSEITALQSAVKSLQQSNL